MSRNYIFKINTEPGTETKRQERQPKTHKKGFALQVGEKAYIVTIRQIESLLKNQKVSSEIQAILLRTYFILKKSERVLSMTRQNIPEVTATSLKGGLGKKIQKKQRQRQAKRALYQKVVRDDLKKDDFDDSIRNILQEVEKKRAQGIMWLHPVTLVSLKVTVKALLADGMWFGRRKLNIKRLRLAMHFVDGPSWYVDHAQILRHKEQETEVVHRLIFNEDYRRFRGFPLEEGEKPLAYLRPVIYLGSEGGEKFIECSLELVPVNTRPPEVPRYLEIWDFGGDDENRLKGVKRFCLNIDCSQLPGIGIDLREPDDENDQYFLELYPEFVPTVDDVADEFSKQLRLVTRREAGKMLCRLRKQVREAVRGLAQHEA